MTEAERAVHVAQQLHAKGISTGMDARGILEASGIFTEEATTDVCGQLKVIRDYEDASLRSTEPAFRPLLKPERGTQVRPHLGV